MAELTLELAKESDAPALAEISRRAFDSDVACGAPGPGGPPGYDSAGWQKDSMRRASAYWNILLDGQLVGGAIVMALPRGRYYLARIFLDPSVHHQDLGVRAMSAVLAAYPEARVWRLETPPWNTRTRAFYEKLGFRIVRQTEDDLFFQKTLSDGHAA